MGAEENSYPAFPQSPRLSLRGVGRVAGKVGPLVRMTLVLEPALCCYASMRLEHPINDPQTEAEERLNWLSHGAGLLLSLVGLATLYLAARPLGWAAVAACTVYGLTLVAMLGVSTCYHTCPHGRPKQVARLLDHCCIPLLIAGSYTPFMVLALGGWRGWAMMVAIWGLATLSIRHKLTSHDPFGAVSVGICLLMGWLVMAVWKPLVLCLDPAALRWLVTGGVLYTAGVPFYAWSRLPYNHSIWHLFVLAGAASHFAAVLALLL